MREMGVRKSVHCIDKEYFESPPLNRLWIFIKRRWLDERLVL